MDEAARLSQVLQRYLFYSGAMDCIIASLPSFRRGGSGSRHQAEDSGHGMDDRSRCASPRAGTASRQTPICAGLPPEAGELASHFQTTPRQGCRPRICLTKSYLSGPRKRCASKRTGSLIIFLLAQRIGHGGTIPMM